MRKMEEERWRRRRRKMKEGVGGIWRNQVEEGGMRMKEEEG